MASCTLNGIDTIMANIGIEFSTFVLILIFIMGLMFYARGFRVGLITHFLLYALNFIWFYIASTNYSCNYNFIKPLVLMMFFFALMTITILSTREVQSKQTFI